VVLRHNYPVFKRFDCLIDNDNRQALQRKKLNEIKFIEDKNEDLFPFQFDQSLKGNVAKYLESHET